MIAKNYIKHPEALRFQVEMFSRGYHNSPRIMRLMECIFSQAAAVPDWWKLAKARARALAKTVKTAILDIFGFSITKERKHGSKCSEHFASKKQPGIRQPRSDRLFTAGTDIVWTGRRRPGGTGGVH